MNKSSAQKVGTPPPKFIDITMSSYVRRRYSPNPFKLELSESDLYTFYFDEGRIMGKIDDIELYLSELENMEETEDKGINLEVRPQELTKVMAEA